MSEWRLTIENERELLEKHAFIEKYEQGVTLANCVANVTHPSPPASQHDPSQSINASHIL